MILRTRVLAAFVVLVAASPVFAGTIERFLLPRTTPVRVRAIAATADYAWVLPEAPAVGKVGLDGSLLEIIVLGSAGKIAADPIDGSLWYTGVFRLQHLTTSGEIVELDVPSNAQDLIFGPDDHLWMVRTNDLLRISRTGEVTTFSSAGGFFNRLAAGPDGNVWISNHYAKAIQRMTPSGTLSSFTIEPDYPTGITAGPDGNLWFVSNGGSVRRITTAGAITEVVPWSGGYNNIVTGADGRLWWDRDGKLSKFNIGSSTVETTYTVTTADDSLWALSASTSGVWWGSESKKLGRVTYAGESISAPFNFAGPDPWMLASTAEHLWFTAPNENQIGRVTPAGGETVLYTLPHADNRPLGIVAVANAVWFTEESGNRVGTIDAGGAVQEFTVPASGGKPSGIAYGADKNFWITLAAADKVVRMTSAGVFTEFPLAAGCQPTSIAAGPDSALWFTCEKSNEIGRISHAGAVTMFGAQGSSPSAIALASDGNLWYTTQIYNHRITPAGSVTSWQSKPAGWRGQRARQRVNGPDGALWDNTFNSIVRTTTDGASHSWDWSRVNGRAITVGPDGKIWFSDSNTQSLYRFDPDAAMTGTGMTICPEEGRRVSGPAASFTDPDTARGIEMYTAWIDWGDLTYPTAGQISMTSPGHFVVSGSHLYDNSATRTIRIAFTALPGPGRLGATAFTSSVVGGFTATPSATSFPSEGGSGTVTIAGANCPWSASVSDSSMIALGQSASGQGAGSFQFTVTANSAPFTRTGSISVAGSTLTITQAPHSSAFATGFYTVTPCRLVDTRVTQNPMPGGGLSRSIWIPAGTCGIPSGARVLSANVTVVSPPGAGWLAFYPPDSSWPGNSTLNYRAGQTRANNTLMQLASNGFVVLNSGPQVDFIVDVNGYFK